MEITIENHEKALRNRGLCGLQNIGNTCFMNAALQCLANTRLFTLYFLSEKYRDDINPKKEEVKLVIEYVKLIREMWSPELCVIAPNSFKKVLSQFNNRFIGWLQHDSNEVIKVIIDIFHTALSYEADIRITGSAKTELDKLQTEAIKTWISKFSGEYSVPITLFYGQFFSTTTCSNCRHVSKMYDPFNSIELEITSDCRTIYDCLNHYTHGETLDDDNKYRCEKCNVQSNARKRIQIWKPPNILVISFKRFSPMNKKIDKLVEYPVAKPLNMSKYVCGYDKERAKYNLYAICNHTGNTNGGHYYAYCKNISGAWHMFNDDRVLPVKPEALITNHAYVLFYEKIGVSPNLIES